MKNDICIGSKNIYYATGFYTRIIFQLLKSIMMMLFLFGICWTCLFGLLGFAYASFENRQLCLNDNDYNVTNETFTNESTWKTCHDYAVSDYYGIMLWEFVMLLMINVSATLLALAYKNSTIFANQSDRQKRETIAWAYTLCTIQSLIMLAFAIYGTIMISNVNVNHLPTTKPYTHALGNVLYDNILPISIITPINASLCLILIIITTWLKKYQVDIQEYMVKCDHLWHEYEKHVDNKR